MVDLNKENAHFYNTLLLNTCNYVYLRLSFYMHF